MRLAPRRGARSLAAAVALATASVSPLLAEGPLPVGLVDPVRGGEVRLEAGAPALHVVFFAVWCEPCLGQLARLREVEERWRDAGYRLVLVGVPARESAERLARFAADASPPGELLFDESGEAGARFSVGRVPEHVLLDAEGRIVGRGPGPDSIDDAAIRKALQSGVRPGEETR